MPRLSPVDASQLSQPSAATKLADRGSRIYSKAPQKPIWGSEDRSGGPIRREFGAPVAQEVTAVLRKAAENGNMKQIAVNDVWSWVCLGVAIRSDPSVEKEKA